MQTKTKVKEAKVRKLFYADGCALYVESEGDDMQATLHTFTDACNNFGFTIDIQKMKLCSSLLQMQQMLHPSKVMGWNVK